MSVCNLRQVPRCNLPVKGLLLFPPNRWVLTLIRHLLGAAAETHLCHGGTKPVISANIAVKGAAGLLSAQECDLAARLVTPVPSLSFLFCFVFSPRRLGSRRHPAVSATVGAQSSIRPPLRHRSSRLVLVLNSYRFDFSRRRHNCKHTVTHLHGSMEGRIISLGTARTNEIPPWSVFRKDPFMQSQHPAPSYAPADMHSRINLTSHKLRRIKIMKRRHAESSGEVGWGGFQICKMKMNPAEYTRHTGLATDTSEREPAAWRPAEITQVSLSRLFSAFMTAKWQKKNPPETKQPHDCFPDRHTQVNRHSYRRSN